MRLLGNGPCWVWLTVALLWGMLLVSALQASAARVIYYNTVNRTQAQEQDPVGKGMLFAVRRLSCRRGYMYDHNNRCRRVV